MEDGYLDGFDSNGLMSSIGSVAGSATGNSGSSFLSGLSDIINKGLNIFQTGANLSNTLNRSVYSGAVTGYVAPNYTSPAMVASQATGANSWIMPGILLIGGIAVLKMLKVF